MPRLLASPISISATTLGLVISVAALVASAQPVALTVEEGYASRNPVPGAVAHIFARNNTATEVFERWSGDTQYLLDPDSPFTTLVMPGADVRLRANYRTVPAWTARTATLSNVPVTYYIPPDPVALLFHFHGTGGTGANLFVNMEFLSFTRDLVAAGIGVVAFDSLNRTTAQWNTSVNGPTNPDIVRVNGVLSAMKAQGLVRQDIPLLAFGQSNGGFFAHFSSLVMNWRAVALTCFLGGGPLAASGYNGPVLWWMQKNDDSPDVGEAGNATSLQRYETHVNRGQPGRHIISAPMPLYPERFTRGPLLTLQDSREVYELFKNRGWIDENDFLKTNPNEQYWQSALPARYTDAMKTAITVQLGSTYANHVFANHNPHIFVDHYLRALGLRPPARPVNAASLGGASIAADSVASFSTQALADGLESAPDAAPETGLHGVKGVLRATSGAETPVRWFSVSPAQGKFLVPAGLAPGNYVFKIESAERRWSLPVSIAAVAPGIFTANGDGKGAPAGVIQRVAPDDTRSEEFPFAPLDGGGFGPAPIRFGEDRLILDLYTTGLRGAGSFQVLLGTEPITPLSTAPKAEVAGVDQVSIELPPSFAGRGKVEVVIVVDGVRSNTVELNFEN